MFPAALSCQHFAESLMNDAYQNLQQRTDPQFTARRAQAAVIGWELQEHEVTWRKYKSGGIGVKALVPADGDVDTRTLTPAPGFVRSVLDMRLVALVVVCALIVGQDGGSAGETLPGLDSAQRARATGSVLSALRRRSAGEFVAEDPNPCFSLRENEDQRQLLCNDRRSKFNFNPFGLRFGKRHSGYVFRRARTNKLSPLSLFLRELEVPT